MGSELQCKVRIRGKALRGKALLETSEMIFRGDSSFKIPLASIQSVNAKDGELHLTWKDGGRGLRARRKRGEVGGQDSPSQEHR